MSDPFCSLFQPAKFPENSEHAEDGQVGADGKIGGSYSSPEKFECRRLE